VILGSSALFSPLLGHYFVVYEVFYVLILIHFKEGRKQTLEGEIREGVKHNAVKYMFLKLILFSSGMKREADGEMSSPQKRFRSGDDITIRLLIPSKVSEDCSHEITPVI